MPIAAIDAERFRIPLPQPLSDATHGMMTEFELVVVRVRASDGSEGTGWTYTVGAGGGAIASLIQDDLAPLLVGLDEGRIERLWQRMWWALHFVGRGGAAAFAIAAVDIALHDLAARQTGEPLWRRLGGHDPEVIPYAGGVDLEFPLERLLEQTEANIDRGFRAIKMKIGSPSLRRDVARVEAMRDKLGPGIPLMADANMRWRVDQAIAAARALRPADLIWLEEPIQPEDVAGHVQVQRDGGLPLAAGENFHSLAEFRALIAAGGVAFPEPDLATLGGITPWMKVAKLAEAFNLPVTSHGVHDLHVHLLAAVPNASFLEIHGFGLERFIEQPLEVRNGVVQAPERPGHGVAFDWPALRRHAA